MLVHRHKQLTGVLAVLAIVLVQFFAQVHAAEHPFHQEDVLCLPMQSVAKDLHFFQTTVYVHYENAYISAAAVLSIGRISPFLNPHYSSRAPPKTTI